MSTAGGEPEQLTFVDHGSNSTPRWSPDGRYLFFLSSRVDDKPQVFRLSVAGGDAMQVTTFATGVADFVLSPDGNTLAIVASVFPSCSDMACNAKRLKDHTDDHGGPESAWSNNCRRQLWRLHGQPAKLLYFEMEGHGMLKPADSVLWYHTVLGWIDQWVKPDRAEYQRLLTASASSGAPGAGSGATALTRLAWFTIRKWSSR